MYRGSAPVRGKIILISVNSPGCVSTSIETAVLLHNNVVADGKAKTGAFSGRFGCEERIEHLFFHIRRDTGAVIADLFPHNRRGFWSRPSGWARSRRRSSLLCAWSQRKSHWKSDSEEPAGCPAGKRRPHRQTDQTILSLISKPCFSARAPCQARLRLSSTRALISTTRCSPEPSRECCSIFLTMASARLP